jgi:sporulation protein YlmC with PRC-barrel domain
LGAGDYRYACCIRPGRDGHAPVGNQERERATMVVTRQLQEMYGVVPASKIIGESVVNRQDEKLGKIHDLVIDAHEGRLAYAVLSMGGKYFAMPWTAFEFANTENKLVLDVDKKKLQDAPGFDKKDKWPDFADRSWGGSIYKYYDRKPYWDL